MIMTIMIAAIPIPPMTSGNVSKSFPFRVVVVVVVALVPVDVVVVSEVVEL